MAKSNTQAAGSDAQQAMAGANATIPGVVHGLQSNAADQQQVATGTENLAQSGYTAQQTTGGFNPQQLANVQNLQTSLQPTGGYNPQQLAQLQTQLANMQGAGGYNPKQLAMMNKGYGQMATTGGFTGQDIQNYLQQATQGSTATASNAAAAAQRAAAGTGGNAQAAIAALGQQAGAAQGANTNAALANLTAQINQNKLAGLGGEAALQSGVAAAKQGVTGQEAGLQAGVAQGAQNMAAQQAGLASNVAAGTNAANAGLAGLYSTAGGLQTAQQQQALQGLGLLYGTDLGAANVQAAISSNPGLFQTGLTDTMNLLRTFGA